MTRLGLLISIGLVVSLATGCGVKKQTHQKALDRIVDLEGNLDTTTKDRDRLRDRTKSLEDELSATQAERDRKSEAQRELEARVKKLIKDLSASEEQSEEELAKLQEELEELRRQRDKLAARGSALRAINERFRALVDTGKLDVGFRNGQMVLKLPSEVLFASAKGELSKTGKAALQEVLDVLLEFKDRRFLVAGHTDNIRVRSRKYKNNWNLSTSRAVSVVQFMIEAGFDGDKLGAAGYGQFDPIANNDTKENRAKNRRIEIILVPDLSDLPDLLAEPPE
jgi:chemotaxis protein MotB